MNLKTNWEKKILDEVLRKKNGLILHKAEIQGLSREIRTCIYPLKQFLVKVERFFISLKILGQDCNLVTLVNSS